MASISTDKKGNRRILFSDPADGNRKTVYLGSIPKKLADEFKTKVEHLVSFKAQGLHPDPILAAWINALSDILHGKLSAAGLVQERGTASLGAFIAAYVAGRGSIKKGTLASIDASTARIIRFFGAEKNLRDIHEGDADDFAVWLKTEDYAAATAARTLKHARQFLSAAVKRRLAVENPFMSVKIPSMVNKTRLYYVTRPMAAAILDACPDLQWRLLFALCRFGGLRCPSEPLSLLWEDVDFSRERIRIRSPKKEGDEDGGERIIPIFPELRALLTEAFERAEVGQPYVITKYRDTNANLRTQMRKIIRRAGLKPWPRMFQNLRASRETELASEHPLHVVVAWLGNSARVATSHYLQITDLDFEKAARGNATDDATQTRNGTRHEPATISGKAAGNEKSPENSGLLRDAAHFCGTTHHNLLAAAGLEPARGLLLKRF